jgi:hypothetical protein
VINAEKAYPVQVVRKCEGEEISRLSGQIAMLSGLQIHFVMFWTV